MVCKLFDNWLYFLNTLYWGMFYIVILVVTEIIPIITSLKNIRFGGVMVSVLASNAVDRGFRHRSGQTKDFKIGICCFSAKHIVLRRKSKDWLARNQNNVSHPLDKVVR